MEPPPEAKGPAHLGNIARSPKEPTSLQLGDCHMRLWPFGLLSCHGGRRADRGTCTGHRADMLLACAEFQHTPSWVVASSRRPSPFGQACAAERRSPWPPGWTSVLGDRTHGRCGVRCHALVDGRCSQLITPVGQSVIQTRGCPRSLLLASSVHLKTHVGCNLRPRTWRRRRRPIGSTYCLVKAAFGLARRACARLSTETWMTAARPSSLSNATRRPQ